MAEDSPLVVDFGAHVNLNPPEGGIFEYIEETVGEPVHSDIDSLLELYEDGDVDRAVLSQTHYMGHEDAKETAAANDELLDAIGDHDELYGLASLPTAAGGDAAAAEFERCLDNGFNGAAIANRSDGIEIIDEEVEPILEVADRTGAPLLVHPIINDSLGSPDVLSDDWRLNAIFGREMALCESLCKAVHEGVLDRHPNLDLVYHHTGGNIASMLGRVELQLDPARWPDRSDRNLKSYDEFKSQLDERVYFDLSGHDGHHGTFSTTVEELPASQLMYGTDFPYETRRPETFRKIVDAVENVAPADADQILGENAMDLLINVD